MDGSREDSFNMDALETAVSMASIAEEDYPSNVFTGMDALDLLRDTPQKLYSDSTTKLLGSLGAMEESASSFQYVNTAMDSKTFSDVVLKPEDPMWQTPITPEPPIVGNSGRSPQAKIDRDFVDSLLATARATSASPIPSSSIPASPVESSSLPPFSDRKITPPHHKKSSSGSDHHFHMFHWGRSHTPTEDHASLKMEKSDSMTDGQKASTSGEKSHFHLKWPHRTKHHSTEDKKSDEKVHHGSSHHFQDFVHIFRRLSHSGSSHKDIMDDKESISEPPRKHHRVQRIASGGANDIQRPPVVIRDRSHSMGARPKKRTSTTADNTIQSVYSIYDDIVKEGKHAVEYVVPAAATRWLPLCV